MSECLKLGGQETTIDWHCDTVYHSCQIGQEKKDWTDDIFNFTESVKWNRSFHWISLFWFRPTDFTHFSEYNSWIHSIGTNLKQIISDPNNSESESMIHNL